MKNSEYTCKFCKTSFINKSGLISHEMFCKENPDRDSNLHYEQQKCPKCGKALLKVEHFIIIIKNV